MSFQSIKKYVDEVMDTFPPSEVVRKNIQDLLLCYEQNDFEIFDYYETLFELIDKLSENYDELNHGQSQQIFRILTQEWDDSQTDKEKIDLVLVIAANLNIKHGEAFLRTIVVKSRNVIAIKIAKKLLEEF